MPGEVRQPLARAAKVRLELHGDSRVDPRCERGAQPQGCVVGALLDVPLPTAERHREAALEQEPVARVDPIADLERRRPAEGHDGLAAPVDHRDEQAAARATRVGGPQETQLGREPDPPISAARSPREVRDGAVRGMRRIDGKVDERVDALVRSAVAKRRAALVGPAAQDLDLLDGHGGSLRVS
jgi:hypothetical protein